MFKSSSPLNVQFEITYQCNNRCIFCYNGCDSRSICPVSTEGAKRILHNLVANGVLGVNFNGGEPLTRDDFFELAAYAKDLGLDIHLNTNATLVCDEVVAKKIATLFPLSALVSCHLPHRFMIAFAVVKVLFGKLLRGFGGSRPRVFM